MTEQRKQKQRIGLLGPHSVNSLTTNNFKIWTRSEEERKGLLLWPSGDSEVNGNTSAPVVRRFYQVVQSMVAALHQVIRSKNEKNNFSSVKEQTRDNPLSYKL